MTEDQVVSTEVEEQPTPAEIVTEEVTVHEAASPAQSTQGQLFDMGSVSMLANETLTKAKDLPLDACSAILVAQVLQGLVGEVRTIKHLMAEFIGVSQAHAPVQQVATEAKETH